MKKFEFQPKQWVLVRDNENEEWTLCQFSHYIEKEMLPYSTCGGASWNKCIPYKGNKHLLGTTDQYVEKWMPKDGDFVICSKGSERKSIFIFEKMLDNEVWTYAIYFFSDSKLSFLRMSRRFESATDLMRPATEDEKNQLLSKLHEIGKDWDAEKKEVVEWKWRPKYDKSYYHPKFYSFQGFVAEKDVWRGSEYDRMRFLKGYVFRTKEECQEKCNRLNEAIKNVK